MKRRIIFTFIIYFGLFNFAISGGNISIQSFNKAKKILEKQVYYDYPYTFYCNAKI